MFAIRIISLADSPKWIYWSIHSRCSSFFSSKCLLPYAHLQLCHFIISVFASFSLHFHCYTLPFFAFGLTLPFSNMDMFCHFWSYFAELLVFSIFFFFIIFRVLVFFLLFHPLNDERRCSIWCYTTWIQISPFYHQRHHLLELYIVFYCLCMCFVSWNVFACINALDKQRMSWLIYVKAQK